jgi:hypothetical protein
MCLLTLTMLQGDKWGQAVHCSFAEQGAGTG